MSVPTTSSEPTLAPTPGSARRAVVAPEALRYLDALGTWLDLRKGDLDTLDAAALAAADRDAVTGDLVTSMALWKAISTGMPCSRSPSTPGGSGRPSRSGSPR